MRRTPLKRGTTTLRQTRMRGRSDRRAAETDEWAEIRELVSIRDLGECQARARLEAAPNTTRAETLCLGGNDPHHIWPVGRGGPRLDPDNVITVCRKHHDWAHANPARAIPLGLLA